MNAINVVDKQITDYLVQLNLVQKKAVLSILKVLATDESNYEHEMNKRFEELESRKVKGYTWEESVDYAREAYKSSGTKK